MLYDRLDLEPQEAASIHTAIPNELDKKITGLLTKLQSPWLCDHADNNLEGRMYKRQRKAPHRWSLYKFVLSGNNLYYYTNEKATKPRGILSVSFITPKIPSTEEQLLEQKTSDVSKHHFLVFSPNRMDTLCAQTNEEVDLWHAALTSSIMENLRSEEIAEREEAVKELLPLLAEKSSHDVERILVMINELEHSGFAGGRLKKEKTGNLEMMIESEDGQSLWVKYYFVLQRQCIYYYKNSKSPPKGIITLKFTIIQQEIAPELQFCFRLTTPVSVFVLRAKHHVAMDEWMQAIELSKAGKRRDRVDGENQSLLHEGDDFVDLQNLQNIDIADSTAGYHKRVIPQLTYRTIEGKEKVVKLPLGSMTVGRSDSCNIKIEDKKVSRTHAKIEITEHAAYVVDLGSGHGTKVNRSKIEKQLLKIGDTIKVGKTKLHFDVVKK